MFRKMDQLLKGPWLGPNGPTDGAEGCSLLQELKKACEAGYFFIFTKVARQVHLKEQQLRGNTFFRHLTPKLLFLLMLPVLATSNFGMYVINEFFPINAEQYNE